MYSPVPLNLKDPISLNPMYLPQYTLYTTARLTIAIVISVIFSFIYALIAVKNVSLRKPMIALLDILQSIPVLGYVAFTITGFVALFPGNVIGFEITVIFVAFTCQVWNITYSIYQSILNVPEGIKDASKLFKLNSIQRFLLVELPYSIPSMIWNIMISIANSWFFIVATEAIIEGNDQYYMPGIGSYIASAIQLENFNAIVYAILAMIIIIILIDQLIFRPLLEWSSKFKYEYYSSDYYPSFYYKNI